MIKNGCEVVMLRFEGGPLEGERSYKVTAWPLPDELPGESFRGYRKGMESQIPDDLASLEHIMRGAVYEWEGGGGKYEAHN